VPVREIGEIGAQIKIASAIVLAKKKAHELSSSNGL